MANDTKTCPYCGSEIPRTVKKCKHCGEWLVVQEKDKPKTSLHLGTILEVLIGILSIPIGLNLGADSAISFIIVTYIFLNLYFLPTLIADGKRTQYTAGIFVLNLLLGVTIIVWVGCLAWALMLPNLSKNTENTEIDDGKVKSITASKTDTSDLQCKTKRCPYCAELIPANANYCDICETVLNEEQSNSNIKQWSWGAFWFSWIWGIANKSYLTFWALIPFFGFIWMFVCGVKGNEWAWKNKNWDSIEEFHATQKKWATIGNCIAIPIVFILLMLLLLGTINQDLNLPANNNHTDIQQINSNTSIEERGDIIEQDNEYSDGNDDFIDMREEEYNHTAKEPEKQKQEQKQVQPPPKPVTQPVKQQTTTQSSVVLPQSKQNNQDIDDFMN